MLDAKIAKDKADYFNNNGEQLNPSDYYKNNMIKTIELNIESAASKGFYKIAINTDQFTYPKEEDFWVSISLILRNYGYNVELIEKILSISWG